MIAKHAITRKHFLRAFISNVPPPHLLLNVSVAFSDLAPPLPTPASNCEKGHASISLSFS
jgi:hypothetical protein